MRVLMETLYRHSRLVAAATAAVVVIGLFLAARTLAADLSILGIDEDIVRFFAHFLGFGAIAILISLATRNRFIVAGVITMLIGAVEEFHQAFVPGRYASFNDWLVDASGVVVCLLVVYAAMPWIRKWFSKRTPAPIAESAATKRDGVTPA